MSTEIVTTTEAPAQSFSLAPNSMPEALAFSAQMAACGLIPQHLKESPANCLRLVMQASEWGMNPFSVADCTSVIQGKLMYEGKLTAAVINAKGGLSKRLNYIYKGEGNSMHLTVTGTIKGEDEPRTITLTHALACTINNNGQMQKNPEQQMSYIGARIWGRRHMPELMLGVYGDDESMGDSNAEPKEAPARPSAPKKSKGAAAAIDEMKQADAEVVETEVADDTTSEKIEAEKAEKAKAEKAEKAEKAKAEKAEKAEKAKAEKAEKAEKAKAEKAAEEVEVVDTSFDPEPEVEAEKPAPATVLTAGQEIRGNFAIVSTREALDGAKKKIRILEIKGDEYAGMAYSREPDNQHVCSEGVVYLELSGFKSPSKVLTMIDSAKEAEAI